MAANSSHGLVSDLSLQYAIDFVYKATEEDKNKNYEEALKSYEATVECFLRAMKNGTLSERIKVAIREKCKQYSERAEKIKDYLQEAKPEGDFAVERPALKETVIPFIEDPVRSNEWNKCSNRTWQK